MESTIILFFFSSRRRHTRFSRDWSSDVCSSDLHIAGLFMRALYGVRYTDMCPLRAIRRDALERLGMREKTYGWNLEMQMRAARAGLRILEVPVDHRCRAGGKSKVSGTLRGTFVAGARILATFVR